jgi:hypothetical protein
MRTVTGVQGRLTFQDPVGLTIVTARVVPYGYRDEPRFSWHGDLSARVGQRGELVTEDGTSYPVVVGNGLLKLVESEFSPRH